MQMRERLELSDRPPDNIQVVTPGRILGEDSSSSQQDYNDHTQMYMKTDTSFKVEDDRSSEDIDGSRKRKVQSDEDEEYLQWNEDLMSNMLPQELEDEFVASIFEIGLRNSSPKVLMQLMPRTNQLTTEHIKSHLQKYRLHYARSKEEFLQYYDMHLRQGFEEFVRSEGWRGTADLLTKVRQTMFETETDGADVSDGGDIDCQSQPTASVTLDDIPIETIQELNDQIVHEQMQLQATLQQHIMVQTRLQKQMHGYLKKITNRDTSTSQGLSLDPISYGASQNQLRTTPIPDYMERAGLPAPPRQQFPTSSVGGIGLSNHNTTAFMQSNRQTNNTDPQC